MAQYDYARQQGEDNEAAIEAPIIINSNKLGIGCTTKRNKFIGNNQYEDGWQTGINASYHSDIEVTFDFTNMYTHNSIHGNGKPSWFHGTLTRLIECKYDTLCETTGNLVAEMYVWMHNAFHPSGIMKSLSQLWIVRSTKGRYWVMDTGEFRRLAFSSKTCTMKNTVTGEDEIRGIWQSFPQHTDDSGVPCLIHLIPIPLVEEIALDFGDDINNIDIEKILFYSNEINYFKNYRKS